jgi:hypothetical protein
VIGFVRIHPSFHKDHEAMASVTFACPDCRTNLKTSRRIGADRDVRCPTCGTIFPAPPETNSDLLESYEDNNDGFAEESGTGSEPGTLTSQDATVPAPSSSRRMRRLIVGSALIVVVFTGVTAYFAWSAIVNRGRNTGTGLEDPLAYVPPDSSLVVGINLGQFADRPEWREQIEKGIRNLNISPGFLDDCKKNTGIEFAELFDQVILAYKLDGLNPHETPHTTLIAHSKLPFDQNKIRDAEPEMYPDIVEGKFYYKRNVGQVLDLDYLFMPSNRILILSNLPQYDFEPLVEQDGTAPLLSGEMVTLIRGLQNEPLWAALPLHEPVRKGLQRDAQAAATKAPEIAQVFETLSQARAASAKGRWEEEKFSLAVDLVCADEAAAAKAMTRLQSFWTQQAKGWVGLLPGIMKDRQNFVQEMITQAKFSQEGRTVRLSTRSTPPPADTLAVLIPRLQWITRQPSEARPQPVVPPGRMPPFKGRPGGPNQRPPTKVSYQ